MIARLAALGLSILTGFWGQAVAKEPVSALVLVNGKVLTVDASDSVAEAVSIDGGRIAAVGTTRDIRAHAGDGARVIDLGGRTVIPGLIDSHIHAIRAGLTYGAEISWAGAASLAEGLARIRAAATAAPEGGWLIAIGGWHVSSFPENRLPTADELDAAGLGHPVYVQHLYDTVVLNPAAMRALGIESDADVAPGGRLEIGEAGRPTGVISGGVPTFGALYGRLPKPDFAGQVAGTRAFMSELNRLAMTGIVDAAGGGQFPANYRPLFHLWRGGELTLRVAFRVMSQSRGAELADFTEWTRLLPQGMGDAMLKFNGFGEVITWNMHDGHRPGLPFAPSAASLGALREAAAWMAENGYSAEIHASSDRSARMILDIFEAVNARTPIAPLRWVIAHLDDGTPETLRRMKALGMGYSVQDRFYFEGRQMRDLLGADKASRSPPIKTALGLGLNVSGGTDAPRLSPYNPWIAIRWLVDGKSVDRAPFRGPGETPGRAEALRIYTRAGAWMSFDEQERSSIEPGKLADLAVLSAD